VINLIFNIFNKSQSKHRLAFIKKVGAFMNEKYCSVIIVAAGKGLRMGGDISKQFMKMKNKHILAYTIEAFDQCELVNEIVIVTQKEYIEYCKKEIIDFYNFKNEIKIVEGGSERQYSVYNGLKAVCAKNDIVLIHDGVRPFIKEKYIHKVFASAYENSACVLGVPVKDTIKICDEGGFVENTPNRQFVYAIQTPQAFKYSVILTAHEKAVKDGFLGTDDAMLVERLGYKIKVEQGSYNNIKITTIEDLIVAENLLNTL
jgi:2-C-methyl-D-erythritol 4-phosphate cytidylyltransferase